MGVFALRSNHGGVDRPRGRRLHRDLVCAVALSAGAAGFVIAAPPAGAVAPPHDSLLGVSCASATSCWAVGSSGSKSIAEQWNGTVWTVHRVDRPFVNSLMAVTCVSARNCTAVGGPPGIERLDRTAWSQVRSPDGQLGTLYGVACSSGSSCMAVGNSYVPMGGGATSAEHWNGRHWSISSSVSPSMGANTLSAVSCPAPSNCTAVGYDTGYELEGSQVLVYNQAMVEQWDGHSWSFDIPTAGETNNNSLSGVSCFDATDCIAV